MTFDLIEVICLGCAAWSLGTMTFTLIEAIADWRRRRELIRRFDPEGVKAAQEAINFAADYRLKDPKEQPDIAELERIMRL